MGNHLAHRYYFDTAHSIVQPTISEDLPPLVAAAQRLLGHLPDTDPASDNLGNDGAAP